VAYNHIIAEVVRGVKYLKPAAQPFCGRTSRDLLS
jgi:hypothetical protein